MSRRKRVRKARIAARRARRAERLAEQLEAHAALLKSLRERAAARRELMASDTPEPLKKLLGFIIDPIGASLDLINERVTIVDGKAVMREDVSPESGVRPRRPLGPEREPE